MNPSYPVLYMIQLIILRHELRGFTSFAKKRKICFSDEKKKKSGLGNFPKETVFESTCTDIALYYNQCYFFYSNMSEKFRSSSLVSFN